jgi:hypothetical protein
MPPHILSRHRAGSASLDAPIGKAGGAARGGTLAPGRHLGGDGVRLRRGAFSPVGRS